VYLFPVSGLDCILLVKCLALFGLLLADLALWLCVGWLFVVCGGLCVFVCYLLVLGGLGIRLFCALPFLCNL